jgi:hypothetical protein
LKTNTDRRLVVRASAARLVEWLTAEVAVEVAAVGLATAANRTAFLPAV